MNEIGYEETAFPYDYSRQKIYYIICRVITWLFVLTAVFFGFLTIFSPIENNAWLFPLFFMVWSILMAVLITVLVKPRLYNCYDYIFVSGDVRVIKVVNTKKRKKVISFDSKDVYQVGRYESETYEKHRSMPNVKVIFAPSNRQEVEEKPKYYIAANVDGVKYLVVLECTEKFLRYVLQFAGKPVLEKDYKG